jgi:glutathione peroxidase
MPIQNHKLKTLEGLPVSLDSFRGRVLLIVNVASQCGLTPQYAGLQKLFETYREQGFSVLGFPCNQFAGQEPGTAGEIQTFCETQFGVTFPLFEKIDVNGEYQHPLFAELTAVRDVEDYTGDVRWNFEKWLISRDGEITERFSPLTTPEDPAISAAIERQLAVAAEADVVPEAIESS